ncbi:MAG: redoxin family protein [Phycisphaeraceae bacterium]|nr:MAG: redoxin family protein [Phycisphaeraceae bacterium]
MRVGFPPVRSLLLIPSLLAAAGVAAAPWPAEHAWVGEPGATAADPAALGREVWTNMASGVLVTRAWSFTSKVEGPGQPTFSAQVTLSRSPDEGHRPGPWMIRVEGEIKTSPTQPKGRAVLGVYDGGSAHILREPQREIGRMAGPLTPAEIEAFFARDRAASPVPWEALAADPFTLPDGAAVVHEGREEIDGEPCHRVKAETRPGDAAADASLRVWISERDRLPRRIERFRAGPIRPDSKPIRVQTFSHVKSQGTPAADRTPFAFEAPKGFTVKAEGKPQAVKPMEQARQDVRKPPAPEGLIPAGEPAPAFSLKDVSGQTYTLESLKGKVVVLDFWATWCKPCLAVMPAIQKVHEKYKDKGVVVIGMHTDTNTDTKAPDVMDNLGCDYLLLLSAGAVSNQYKVRGIPSLYVIDAEGRVSWSHVGGSPGMEKILGDAVEAALAASKK